VESGQAMLQSHQRRFSAMAPSVDGLMLDGGSQCLGPSSLVSSGGKIARVYLNLLWIQQMGVGLLLYLDLGRVVYRGTNGFPSLCASGLLNRVARFRLWTIQRGVLRQAALVPAR